MGSFVGNDQNTLLYDFMQKIGIKCRKTCNSLRNLFNDLQCKKNTLDGFTCKRIKDSSSKNMQLRHGRKLQSKAQGNEKVSEIEEKFERVFLGPK